MVDWIWKLCNVAYESSDVAEDWRSTVIVQLYKGTECMNYRGISLLIVVGKIYAMVLVHSD